MRLLSAAFVLVLGPVQAAAMPAGFAGAVRAEALEALTRMEGFAENKAWLDKTGIHIEDLPVSLMAQYEEPRKEGGVGRTLVARHALERSWLSLSSQGVPEAEAARLVGWMLVPSLLHEAQHAIQVHAMSQKVGLSFYALELEIEAEAVGMTAYLQILARFPEMGRHPFFVKTQNNSSLDLWRSGFGAFAADMAKSYPRVPAARGGGVASQLRLSRELHEGMIADVDEALEREELPEEIIHLRAMRSTAAAELARLKDPVLTGALLRYLEEREAAARLLWTTWDRLDPARRAARGEGAPRVLASTSLDAARSLAAASPVHHAGEIRGHLSAAQRAAAASGDLDLRRRVELQRRAFPQDVRTYVRNVIRSNAALAESPAKLEADMKEYLASLREKLSPEQLLEAEALVREELRRARGVPPPPARS